MKKLDKWFIEKREILYDWKNFVLALLVEVSLFSVILILLTITTEMDGIFDRYLQDEMPGMYSVTVKNVKYSDLNTLEEDGIRELYIYSEQLSDGSFYVAGKKTEDYSFQIVSSPQDFSDIEVVEGSSYQEKNKKDSNCYVWITKEMKEEFHIGVGSPIEYKYGKTSMISCVVAGIINAEEDYSVYISFDSLEVISDSTDIERISFEGMGTIDSFVGFDFLQAKWMKRGIKIIADELEELLSVIFFMKAIFVGLSVVGMLLCMIAVCNIYGIKINVRAEFITMLMRLGMREKHIKGIYFDIFLAINVVSSILAYVVARCSINYFNSLLKEKFENMYIVCDKMEIITIGLFVLVNVLMLFSFGRRWAKRNMK